MNIRIARTFFLVGTLLWLTTQPAGGQLGQLISLTPSLSLTDITTTLVGSQTVVGTLTATNVTGGGQSVQVEAVSVLIDFVDSSGASRTCRAVSLDSNLAPGTIIPDGGALLVTFSALCDGGVPLGTSQVVTLFVVTLAGSERNYASSGTLSL